MRSPPRERLFQYRVPPPPPPSLGFERPNKPFSHFPRAESCPSPPPQLLPPPCSPLTDHSSPGNLNHTPRSLDPTQTYQPTAQDQPSNSGGDLYSSPRPCPLECTVDEWIGGRRLYERGSPSLYPPAESPPSQAGRDPSSVWGQDTERREGHSEGEAQDRDQGQPDSEDSSGPLSLDQDLTAASYSSVLQTPPPSDSSCTPSDPLTLLQDLGRRGVEDDSAYYSYFH
ncbi:uncharacterized protein LOC136712539 [Amia ocellicauda]|uniref:uncharacterized protein LOC136712539 n=1 Tax=Amia ocellicauda TaxID=2972642 RepID=UPI003463F48D